MQIKTIWCNQTYFEQLLVHSTLVSPRSVSITILFLPNKKGKILLLLIQNTEFTTILKF